MAEKCSVPGCKTKKSEKITFFPVPVNQIMRHAWSNRIGVKKLSDTDHICAKHFLMKDVCALRQGATPKLRVTAVPKIEETTKPTVDKRIKVKKFAQDIPTLKHETPTNQYLSRSDPKQTNQAGTSSKKSKKKKSGKKGAKVVDPLDIKNEPDTESAPGQLIHSTGGCVDYEDTQNFFYSDMDSRDTKPKDRLAILEAENLQLKTKYSQLINDYVQMKTEKIQLKAELDAALAANQKLIIVKNSLVTTIQTLGKMSDAPVRVNGIPAMIQLDPTSEVSDTIIGF